MIVEFSLYHEMYVFDEPARVPKGRDLNSSGALTTTDQYRWVFRDWDSWSFTQVCCKDPVDPSLPRTGWTKEVMPDGTGRYRQSPTARWELRPAPQDGSTPLPDLAPRWTSDSVHELNVGLEAISGGPEVVSALGIDAKDMVVYGYGKTTAAVFAPLGLPVLSVETNTVGEVIRRLEVTSIDAP